MKFYKSETELMEIFNRAFLNLTFVENCSKCSSNANINYTLRRRKCKWQKCKYQESLLKDTVFNNKKSPLTLILKIIELWCEELPISTIAKGLSLSKKHVGRIIAKMGKKLVANYYKSLEKIGGSNIIVEIDESKFGRRKYNKGHHVEGVWVIGCVERTANKKIILQKVEKRNFLHINNFMTNFINNESIIYSDGWRGYNQAKSNFKDHLTVNHSLTFVNKENNCHTNTIEGNWSSVKGKINRRFRNIKFIDIYLIRFMINRNESGNCFNNLIKYLF
ncbi:hypothetical protein H311_00290 [Anncaliia algerae PRA109]|nr:hypothetical protein H311_00290 [Anncaliia algerae PRA109]